MASGTLGEKYKYAKERGEIQRQIFEDILEFDEVVVHNDLSKDAMMESSISLRTVQTRLKRIEARMSITTIEEIEMYSW